MGLVARGRLSMHTFMFSIYEHAWDKWTDKLMDECMHDKTYQDGVAPWLSVWLNGLVCGSVA